MYRKDTEQLKEFAVAAVSSSVVAVVSGKSVSKSKLLNNKFGWGWGRFWIQWLLKKRNNRILSPISFTLTHWNRTLPNDASSPSSPHLTHTHSLSVFPHLITACHCHFPVSILVSPLSSLNLSFSLCLCLSLCNSQFRCKVTSFHNSLIFCYFLHL